ncbi:MAG: DedA family protein [Epsilonproteobacteria bacterium]|nr:DedA family protein [Campylobacterota bacterium]
MTDMLIEFLKEYSYPILFIWSVMEGETGLVMAGIFSHTGDMNLWLSILVAGLGGFTGDMIYFLIGRYNRKYVYRKFKSQRRKFALAHLLLKKYGWPIIFIQRYLYGMRTIIPIAIGMTRYPTKKFMLINFVSAMVWAAITILLAWYFGEEILKILHLAKDYWYIALPLGALIAGSIIYYFHVATKKEPKKGEN